MIIKTGEKLVHQLKTGEGILYEMTEDLVNPLKLIKTLSKEETRLLSVQNYQVTT